MFWELAGVPAVAARRGTRVESVHNVAACVVDADGAIVLKIGTVETPVFLRSAAKPFIAAASVRAGVLEERMLIARDELERIGAGVDDLRCGPQAPSYGPAAAALAARGEVPTALHNNCSGKHAGILALAKVLGAPFAGYLEPTHPAQRAILALCERVSDDVFSGDRLAVDGCGIPAYATTLRKAALSFARFATLTGLEDDDAAALARVAAAMTDQPWYVAGTGRFDTDLLRVTRGRVVGKGGAEGVHCDALLDAGLGLALKVVDGARRAVPPATIAVLEALHGLEPAAREALEPHARAPIVNAAGTTVGETVALEDWLPHDLALP